MWNTLLFEIKGNPIFRIKLFIRNKTTSQYYFSVWLRFFSTNNIIVSILCIYQRVKIEQLIKVWIIINSLLKFILQEITNAFMFNRILLKSYKLITLYLINNELYLLYLEQVICDHKFVHILCILIQKDKIKYITTFTFLSFTDINFF